MCVCLCVRVFVRVCVCACVCVCVMYQRIRLRCMPTFVGCASMGFIGMPGVMPHFSANASILHKQCAQQTKTHIHRRTDRQIHTHTHTHTHLSDECCKTTKGQKRGEGEGSPFIQKNGDNVVVVWQLAVDSLQFLKSHRRMHDQSVSDHSRGTRTHTDTDTQTDTDTHAISPSLFPSP